MADVKWIKIVTDIFDDEKMYAIECMPDGKDIELIWFKILCLAGKCNQNGFLIINPKLAYTDEMLAKIFRMDIGVVQRALEIFQNLEMIEVVDNAYMVANWLIYQSGDRLEEIKEKNRIRQKRYRESQKTKVIEDKRNVTNNVTDNVTNNVFPSYSYISNSNISNYLYILNECKEEYIEYINSNLDIKECLERWFEYKDERKPKSSNHYGETGIKTLLKKVHKSCLDYGNDNVKEIIEKTMSSTYQGIVWDWLDKKPKKGGSDSDSRRRTDEDQAKREYEEYAKSEYFRSGGELPFV